MNRTGVSRAWSPSSLFRDEGNFAYATARVKARRARLIPSRMYAKLQLMDHHQILQQMMEAGYRKEIDELSATYSGADLVEFSLNRNMATSFRDLLKMTTGGLHDDIERYLARYDVENIKTVLRGNLYNARASRITGSIVAAGAYGEDFFASLARLETLEETVEGLGDTPYARALEDAMPAYRSSGRLDPLMSALERSYFRSLLDAAGTGDQAGELFSGFIRSRIDNENLKNLFRMKSRRMDRETCRQYVIEGGRDTRGRMLREALEAGDMDGLLDACRRLSFYPALKGAAAEAVAKRSLRPLRAQLDRTFMEISRDFSYRYPLSILPILDYVLRKENEVRNLRVIARGKSAGLGPEEIEDLLLV